jgi:hypothetical protein
LPPNPRVLLLDEPTAGMNPHETSEMMRFIDGQVYVDGNALQGISGSQELAASNGSIDQEYNNNWYGLSTTSPYNTGAVPDPLTNSGSVRNRHWHRDWHGQQRKLVHYYHHEWRLAH